MSEKIQISHAHIGSPDGCQRKGNCKNEAFYFVGTVSVCAKHLKEFCKLMDIDFDDAIGEIRENMKCQHPIR